MTIANAYRAVRDPVVWLVDVEPSEDEGIAVARALGHLAAIEIMRAHYLAIGAAREGATAAIGALTQLLNANELLRSLHQQNTPLYDLDEAAVALVARLRAGLDRMPAAASALKTDADFEEAMVMNVTRELSRAFGPTEIGRLVDDRGDPDPRRAMDRVRALLAELPEWANGRTEVAYFPNSWQSSKSGT